MLSSATVPEFFDHAVVKPLMKNKTKPEAENKQTNKKHGLSTGRTTAPFQVALSQLHHHHASNGSFDTAQSAHKKNHSIETLLDVTNRLLMNADRKAVPVLSLLKFVGCF